jgi:hypothetical protein
MASGSLQYQLGRSGEVAGQRFLHSPFSQHEQDSKLFFCRYAVDDNTFVIPDADMPAYFEEVPYFFCPGGVLKYIIPDVGPVIIRITKYIPEQLVGWLFCLIGKNAAIQGVKGLNKHKLNGGNGDKIVGCARLVLYKVFH